MDHINTAVTTGREFLVFSMGAEEYAITLVQVQELRACDHVTRMANAPAFLLGVTNLRGVIVPIIDLRLCLGMDASARGPGSVTMITQHDGVLTGLVVDSVTEVVTLSEAMIRPAPDIGGHLAERRLLRLGTLEQRLLILLDLASLMADMGMAPSPALAA